MVKPYKLHSISAEEAERQNGSKPMNEMVERGVKALQSISLVTMEDYRDAVRAVIASMREPTDQISSQSWCEGFAKDLWPQFIDAALADDKAA